MNAIDWIKADCDRLEREASDPNLAGVEHRTKQADLAAGLRAIVALVEASERAHEALKPRGPGGHRMVGGVCACGQRSTDDPKRCPLVEWDARRRPAAVPASADGSTIAEGDTVFIVHPKNPGITVPRVLHDGQLVHPDLAPDSPAKPR